MSDGNGNTAAAIASAIDDLLKDNENLATRSGLKLILKVFSEGMVIVGKMDKRVSEMEQAYARFTNINSAAMELEEENKTKIAAVQTQINSLHIEVLPEIKSTMRMLKWVGGILTGIITTLLIMFITGQLQLVRP